MCSCTITRAIRAKRVPAPGGSCEAGWVASRGRWRARAATRAARVRPRARGRGSWGREGAPAGAGATADPAHIELCFPTVHDGSLAPEGKHVVTIDVNSQPYEGPDWDAIKEDRADRAISQIAEHFPKLPDLIEHRQV